MNHTPRRNGNAFTAEHNGHRQVDHRTHAASQLRGDQAAVGLSDSNNIQTRAHFANLAFSKADWFRILNANIGLPSELRAVFGTPAIQQAQCLGMNVADNGMEREDRILGRQLNALPRADQFAVLEVIEQFWTYDDAELKSFDEILNAIGVHFCESRREG